ncbi:MAG: Holliday junction resolvase RuvX [Chloroflexi bacterium]|nr:Holliday junction resolvase RuvX [Chloroflexota bacterium]
MTKGIKGVETLRLLALDLGERRIGLAVSNQEGTLVLPVGHLQRDKLQADIQRVLASAIERDAQGIVVGIPYSLDGSEGSQAKRARRFVQALKKQTTLAVYTVDERFTSVEAEGMMREAGRQPSRDRGAVDAAAAALILQRFLDQS